MTRDQQVALWAAINEYVRTCGGHAGDRQKDGPIISVQRQQAVVRVEREVEAALAAERSRVNEAERAAADARFEREAMAELLHHAREEARQWESTARRAQSESASTLRLQNTDLRRDLETRDAEVAAAQEVLRTAPTKYCGACGFSIGNGGWCIISCPGETWRRDAAQAGAGEWSNLNVRAALRAPSVPPTPEATTPAVPEPKEMP